MCAQRRLRSACASAQSDRSLHGMLFGQPRNQCFLFRWPAKTLIDCKDAQADLSPCWAHIAYGTFFHGVAHRILYMNRFKRKCAFQHAQKCAYLDYPAHVQRIIRAFAPHSYWGWSGGAKVSCILCHRGVQLILAYSWARPAILVAG